VNPGNCQCFPGWKGYSCEIPLPCSPGDSCLPGTNCSCLNGGTCGGPSNTVCSCPQGQYASDYCEVVICSGPDFPGGCQQGKCVSPNVCQCNPGWNGTDCSKPICDPPCVHGQCTAPNTCNCFGTGYSHCPNSPPVCGCDENECQRGEKPCDTPIVQCNNFIGSFNCTACPPGSPGTPYLSYPLAPQNKTYYVGGCNSPTPTTGIMPSSSPATTQQTSGQATTQQVTTQQVTTQQTNVVSTQASSQSTVATSNGQTQSSATRSSNSVSSQGSASVTLQETTNGVQESSYQILTPTILGCAILSLVMF